MSDNSVEDHVLYGDLKMGDMFVWIDGSEPSEDMRVLVKLQTGYYVSTRTGTISVERRNDLKCRLINSSSPIGQAIRSDMLEIASGEPHDNT